MNVKWEQKDGATVARIEGRIDSANILVFQRALESSLDPDARNVVVDFEKVVFMSSAGLRVVLMLGKQLRKRGAKLAVCSLSAPIREIFAVSNFDRILPTHSSETQAIDALAGDQEPDAGKAGRLRNTIDFDIVGDNLRDIASFTVEKYEYINNCTLCDEDARESTGENKRRLVAARPATEARAAENPEGHVHCRVERAR